MTVVALPLSRTCCHSFSRVAQDRVNRCILRRMWWDSAIGSLVVEGAKPLLIAALHAGAVAERPRMVSKGSRVRVSFRASLRAVER